MKRKQSLPELLVILAGGLAIAVLFHAVFLCRFGTPIDVNSVAKYCGDDSGQTSLLDSVSVGDATVLLMESPDGVHRVAELEQNLLLHRYRLLDSFEVTGDGQTAVTSSRARFVLTVSGDTLSAGSNESGFQWSDFCVSYGAAWVVSAVAIEAGIWVCCWIRREKRAH